MTWGKMDDKFHRNRKVRELRRMRGGLEALGMWAFWWSWCLDDPDLTGVVPEFELSASEIRLAKLLVEARLWDPVDAGFRFHDFHEYNPTREQRDAKKAADRERISGKRSASRTDVACDISASRHEVASESHPARVPVPSRPIPPPPSSVPSSVQVVAVEDSKPEPMVEPMTDRVLTVAYVVDRFGRFMQQETGSIPLTLAGNSDRTKRMARAVVEWAYQHAPEDPKGIVRASALAFAKKLSTGRGEINGQRIKDPFAMWASSPGGWLEEAS